MEVEYCKKTTYLSLHCVYKYNNEANKEAYRNELLNGSKPECLIFRTEYLIKQVYDCIKVLANNYFD